jgi:hypothetical protein
MNYHELRKQYAIVYDGYTFQVFNLKTKKYVKGRKSDRCIQGGFVTAAHADRYIEELVDFRLRS